MVAWVSARMLTAFVLSVRNATVEDFKHGRISRGRCSSSGIRRNRYKHEISRCQEGRSVGGVTNGQVRYAETGGVEGSRAPTKEFA